VARLYFDDIMEFKTFAEKFRGTARYVLYVVKEPPSLVLRPRVSTSNLDTAIIEVLEREVIEGFVQFWSEKDFVLKINEIVWDRESTGA